MLPLGEFAQIERGGSFQKKDYTEDGFPCIHYGQIYVHYKTLVRSVISHISEDVAKTQKIAHKNNLIMAVTSENLEDVCKTVAWLGDNDIAISGHAAIIRHEQDPRFLAYYFQTQDFFSQKRKIARGTKVIEVSPELLKKVVVPIPSIEKQKEIADKIECFESLLSDVKVGIPAEAEARHKQYVYYRNKLLTFKEKTA